MLEISAGAIVYTTIQNNVYYLIILDNNNNYGFPKGHLEKDETLIQAAIREIKEEVGIDIEIDESFKEELNYIMPNGIKKKAVYFIGKYTNQTPNRQLEEVEKILLLPYDEAYNILTFDNMKRVLKKANDYLNK